MFRLKEDSVVIRARRTFLKTVIHLQQSGVGHVYNFHDFVRV